MKNFDEFVASISEEEMANIIEEAQGPLKSIQDNVEGEARLGNSVAAISYFISLGLLRRYHEWLHE